MRSQLDRMSTKADGTFGGGLAARLKRKARRLKALRAKQRYDRKTRQLAKKDARRRARIRRRRARQLRGAGAGQRAKAAVEDARTKMKEVKAALAAARAWFKRLRAGPPPLPPSVITDGTSATSTTSPSRVSSLSTSSRSSSRSGSSPSGSAASAASPDARWVARQAAGATLADRNRAKLATEARRKREAKQPKVKVVTIAKPPTEWSEHKPWTCNGRLFFPTQRELAEYEAHAKAEAEAAMEAVAKGIDAAAEEIIGMAMRIILKQLFAEGLAPKRGKRRDSRTLREKASLGSPEGGSARYPYVDIREPNVGPHAAFSLLHRQLYEAEGEPASFYDGGYTAAEYERDTKAAVKRAAVAAARAEARAKRLARQLQTHRTS